jgi:hypothetical protein
MTLDFPHARNGAYAGVFMDNDLATQDNIETELNEPTMDETIQSTLDSIKSRDSEAAAELEQHATEAESKPQKQRAPDGKFAKAKDVQVDKQQAEIHGETSESGAPEQTQVPQAQTSNANPPSSWTAAAKAEFSKLNPVIQQEVLKRESDFHKGVEQYREAANYAQSIRNVIAPYENTIRQVGVTPEVAIRELFKKDAELRHPDENVRRAAIYQLARHAGIDLSQGMQQIDPTALRMHQQLMEREAELNQIKTSQAQREQQELNSFLEQAKQGKEHFDSVRNEMAALLQAGTAKDINQAYEMAIWARPDLRQSLLAKQQEERRAEQVKIAQAAKAAAATNVARRGTMQAQKAVGTMDDTIKATLEKIRSR